MTDKQLKSREPEAEQNVQTPVPIHRHTPAVDIYETSDELVLLADVPGVDEQDLQIEVDRQVLTLEADLPATEGEARVSYYRQFRVSEAFDIDAGEAALKDGVLRLRLPKAEAAKAKKIAVKTLH